MKKMNYVAPVAEMIEMSMPSVLMVSDANVAGSTPTGGPTPPPSMS